MSEASKRSSNRIENGKCTNVTNRRSRAGLSTPFHSNPLQLYSLSRISTDLILHNYRSNQSALMTRFGTDLRHQYGIFGGESQTSFTRNATRAGSEEGRLFSQAMCNRDFSVLISMPFDGVLSGGKRLIWRWTRAPFSWQLSERFRKSGKD